MELGIYTSAYNLDYGVYNWKDSVRNFCQFADEVIISTLPEDFEKLSNFISLNYSDKNIKIEVVNTDRNDPEFTGRMKNAALQKCQTEFVIQLDLDEKIPLNQRKIWEDSCELLGHSKYDALFIPSIDLCAYETHYKAPINYKWYLHKRKGLYRGAVGFAFREDGSIDVNKSDSSELIKVDRTLALTQYIIDPNLSDIEKLTLLKSGKVPFVLHYWAVPLSERILKNQIWQNLWNNLNGSEVKNLIKDENKLKSINVYAHNLNI